MSSLAEEIGADIVGYIDLIENYQLEFKEDMTYARLIEKIAYVKDFPFVRYAEVNFVTPCEEQYFTNDALYTTDELWETIWKDENGDGVRQDKEMKNIKKTDENDDWSNFIVAGNNWGLEALNVHMAWEYKNYFQGAVKVGIYDNMYGQNEDLAYSAIYNNPGVLDSVHGTHVAGIIGAKHNNGKGISGVSTNARLYAYTAGSSFTEDVCTFVKMINQGVRVINVSYSCPADFAYSATIYQTGKAHELIMRQSNVVSQVLDGLINQGYDFLIVVAAGNGNGKTFVKDPEGDFEYSIFDDEKESHDNLRKIVGTPDAKYSFYFNAIEKDSVKNRIMVVGAVKNLGKEEFTIANFSQEGLRVDTYAPGVDILSTVPKTGFGDSYMVL